MQPNKSILATAIAEMMPEQYRLDGNAYRWNNCLHGEKINSKFAPGFLHVALMVSN